MNRRQVKVMVNGRQVPNTIVYDADSTLGSTSDEYVEDLVRQLISPNQNIAEVKWEVVDLDTQESPVAEEDPDTKPIPADALSLFNTSP